MLIVSLVIVHDLFLFIRIVFVAGCILVLHCSIFLSLRVTGRQTLYVVFLMLHLDLLVASVVPEFKFISVDVVNVFKSFTIVIVTTGHAFTTFLFFLVFRWFSMTNVLLATNLDMIFARTNVTLSSVLDLSDLNGRSALVLLLLLGKVWHKIVFNLHEPILNQIKLVYSIFSFVDHISTTSLFTS